jgi:pimeloyl-ACP methyl ester carboxylesterase
MCDSRLISSLFDMIRTGPPALTAFRRSRLATTAVALALLAGTAGAAGLASPASSAPAPAAAVKDCPEKSFSPTVRCGQVLVPVDRGRPGSATISVAYVLLPRQDRSRPSLGTLVPNPGGPGAGVIDQAEGYVETLGPLLDRRDLLLVDPRGTGRSTALHCAAAEAVSALRADTSELVAACGRELGAQANSYGSAAIADDIEAVRSALGLDDLDLWGESYGTYLMQVYASRHPAHVRSVMLSGAYPVDFDPWGRDRLRAARRAVTLVCRRSGDCSGPAVLREVAQLADRLRAHPVSFSVDVGGHRQRTVLDEAALAQLLYAGGQASTYGKLPAAVHSALHGDRAALQQLVAGAQLEELALLHYPSFSVAAYAATECHDYPHVFSYADSPAVRRVAYQRALSDLPAEDVWPFSAAGWAGAGFEGVDDCIGWPADSSPSGSPPASGSPLEPGATMPDVPVLVLSGDLDANTPTEAGRLAAAAFQHSTVLEIPNAGHTPGDDVACANAVARHFVATVTVDRKGCVAEPVPVARPAARTAATLPAVTAAAGRQVRTALAVTVATAEDLRRQAGLVRFFGSSDALRSGRYQLVTEDGADVLLQGVKVVADARVGGRLTLGDEDVVGTVTLTGRGVPDGRLSLRLSGDGSGRATGKLAGRAVDLRFRF